MAMDQKAYDAIFIGGGAASFFAALRLASLRPEWNIILLEKGKTCLEKVRISGGGRCNVTNKIEDPKALAAHYPRGQKALVGPFHQFSSFDTKQWFQSRGVQLKTEEDGRVFPVSDSSSTIIECLFREAQKYGLKIQYQSNVQSIAQVGDNWQVSDQRQTYIAPKLFLGSGSNPRMWRLLDQLGVACIPEVPSLFTFNTKDSLLKGLAGISVASVRVSIPGIKMEAQGPLLITHWGLSGPGILRLSAWGARHLAAINYQFEMVIQWLTVDQASEFIQKCRAEQPKKHLSNTPPATIPTRLWHAMLRQGGIDDALKWADATKKVLQSLESILCHYTLSINGKSTFKEEFVTAGGVDLHAVNLKHFNLKAYPNIYLAGEILDIDGITGGFNFQAAWTGGWIAGTSMAAIEVG